MIFLLLLLFFISVFIGISYIINFLYYASILIQVTSNNYEFGLFCINEYQFYISCDDYISKYIVYKNNNEIIKYFCKDAYKIAFDSNITLICHLYEKQFRIVMLENINKNNIDLLKNYESSLNLRLLINKIPNDIIIHISKFITSINVYNQLKN